MLDKLLHYIKLKPKTLVVIVILLVLLDLGVRNYWQAVFAEPGKARLINEELATLQTMQDHIKAADGFKIVFIGDSQTYGSAVKSGDKTIPYFLEQELKKNLPGKDVKVFNLAFKGFGISENYFIVNSLVNTGVDMVIYNVSTGWFNRDKVLEHHNVIHLSETYYQQQQVMKTKVEINKSKKARISSLASRLMGRVWYFYQTRSALTTKILGKPLRQKITDWQLMLTNPGQFRKKEAKEADLFKPWHLKNWDDEVGTMNYVIGNLNLSPNNPQVVFYNLILDMLSENRIPAVIYTSPQNFDLLEQYDKIDREAWVRSMVQLEEITARDPLVYYTDYTGLVPNRYFTDTVHMTDKGNRILAQEIAKDVTAKMGVDDPS